MSTVPLRSAISPDDRYNRESLFATPDEWRAAFDRVISRLAEADRFKGHLGDSPSTLVSWLSYSEDVALAVGQVFVYALMENAVDKTDQAANEMADMAYGMMGRWQAAFAFASPELLTIGQVKLNEWLQTEPRLQAYQQMIDDLFRQQEHVRSGEVEELLGLISDPFNAFANSPDALINADLKFAPARSSSGEELPLTHGTEGSLLYSTDREVRRTAWENYADGFIGVKNALAAGLSGAMKRDVFYMRARRFDSVLEAQLFQYNLPTNVFHNLVETYKKHIPTWHRYWRARKKALGVDQLHPYDIWAPLTQHSPKIDFQQAVDMICAGMAPLGEDYVSTLRRGCLEQRWVDFQPNQGKTEGAFSFGWQGTHPFINMSFNGDLRAMSTLAHELGHSMHSYYTWQNQPFAYTDYSMFVAETASNFNQAMVRAHLLQTNTDRDFQLALIDETMNNIHRYFFIMPTLSRFELEVHQRVERGEGLTAEALSALMADLFAEGYGDEVHVDRERVGITWAQFGHLYVPYYTFQYATGISAAHALAARILNGDAGAAEKYLEFLATGNALYPLDALKVAGVDMTTPQAVEETFGVLEQVIERLESLF
ncbi:MAG: oligoendopeptidase F [Chloroflexi bacterium]|uniref:oligoendopeptidase F n=1 Tax=Candidatus Flexifilum breve TaxID=3140694 RepID=UPI003135C3C2|nr:oligoendopeptidase F [Chloroflexota bacterium]